MPIYINGGSSGGSGSASTGDITFAGVQIIGAGEGSGDGYGYSTIEIVPDANLTANDQYLVIDPTAPNHIHIRAGGEQDFSNAELILGGEHAHVRVVDNGHEVTVRADGGLSTGLIQILGSFGANQVHAAVGSGVTAGSIISIDGSDYTVTSILSSPEDGLDYFFISPDGDFSGVDFANGLGVSCSISYPSSPKTWTFGNDGVLDLAEGGVRFADNTVQTTAGMPLSGVSWDDGNYGGGSVSFGNSSVGVSRSVDYNGQSAGAGIGIYDIGDGTTISGSVTVSGAAGGVETQLSITRHGITFSDSTTQGTAGVVSTDPGASGFEKINNILKLSQDGYNTLADLSQIDPNTLYIIVD